MRIIIYLYLLLMTKQLKPNKSQPKKPRIKVEEPQPHKKQQQPEAETAKKQGKVKKEKKLGKRNRLIIRNIVFDIGEKHLRKLLAPYGEIVDIEVPLNPNNQKCNKGFAFVEFANYRSCQKAIKELNQTTFKGRPIVIDFSIAKTKFVSERIQEGTKEKEEEPKDQHQSQNEDKEQQKPAQQQEESTHKPEPNNDSEDLSRTIFIRNMPISVEEATLKEFCGQYGRVKWAKIVVDKETKVSKGTAFVKYFNPEHAKALIEYSRSYELFLLGKNPHFKRDPKINLDLEGTIIKIFPVQKRQAIAEKMKERDELQEKKNKKLKPLKKIKKLKDLILYDKNGKRNIALAQLGFWEANETMSDLDQQKFKRHAREKIEKLKNPNHIVSDRRVILKYLDKSITEPQIKEVALDCLSANKVPHKQLTYCKLMLDSERQRSAGYAFLQFKRPETARMFVEQLAENQEALMPQPFVVEFSVQDSRKIKKLEAKSKG